MIEITEQYQLSSGEAPYQFTITADDNCVNFTPGSGTTDENGIFTLVHTFPNETCITGTTFTASGTDANNCNFSENFTVTNICANLTLSSIGNPGNLQFTAGASSSTAVGFTFKWTYDTGRFTQQSLVNTSGNSTITLKLNNNSNSSGTSQIRVDVTDDNGCNEFATLSFTPCVPSPPNLVFHLYQTQNGVNPIYKSGTQVLGEPTNCPGLTFDMSDIDLELPAGFVGTIIGETLTISFTGTPANIAYSGTYSITSQEGTQSSLAQIDIIVHKEAIQTISAPDYTFLLDCNVSPGETVKIPLEENLVVTEGTEVDWDSWQLVTNPSMDDPASTSITLGTDSSGLHVIEYLVPDPIVTDVFRWILCDTDGVCSKGITYTVSQCAEAPELFNDTATVACGETVEIDILANDLPNGSSFLVNTIQIVTSPTNGDVVVDEAGNALYTANELFSGADSFTYLVANSFGTVAETAAQVDITVVCAGANTEVALCN